MIIDKKIFAITLSTSLFENVAHSDEGQDFSLVILPCAVLGDYASTKSQCVAENISSYGEVNAKKIRPKTVYLMCYLEEAGNFRLDISYKAKGCN